MRLQYFPYQLIANGEAGLQVRIAWLLSCELGGDCQVGAEFGERAWEVAEFSQHQADPIVRDREIILPVGVTRILRRDLFRSEQLRLELLQRLGELPLLPQCVADAAVSDRNSVSRICPCNASGDCPRLLIFGQCIRERTLFNEDVPEPIVGIRKIALPTRVARILRHNGCHYLTIGPVFFRCDYEIMLLLQDIADTAVRDTELPLPEEICCVPLRQLLCRRQFGAEFGERAREVALRLHYPAEFDYD